MVNFLQPPRLRIREESEEKRRATWLELFYDLVFVVAVYQLAHNLHDDVTLSGFFGFVTHCSHRVASFSLCCTC